MAFDVRCKNCGFSESDHYWMPGFEPATDCEIWEPERELTEEERQELINNGVTPSH